MDLFKRILGASQDENQAGAAPAVEPRHITAAEFDAVILGSALPAVVDFWAEWCGPCHAIAPSVANLASEFDGRALVAKLDADEAQDILARYGIMGIPTLLYFKEGKELDRVVGMTGYGTLKKKLERLLA
ncbi:MAG: thioredoxin [Chloroflexi bacterium]|nr:thioredoxin [Chloroflexota bacterium]